MLKGFIVVSMIVVGLFGASVSIERAHYDYHKKFQKEDSTKILMVGRAGRTTLVGSAEEVSRYGLKDKQIGVEVYIPLLKKEDKLYVNSSLFVAPSNEFLTNYEYSLNVYKGIFDATEIGVGYKEMDFNANRVHLSKFMISTNAINGIQIGETVTFNIKDKMSSYDTYIIFNNDKNLKMKYTYGFGDSLEDFGVNGLREIEHRTHTGLISYKIVNSTEIGLMYVHEVYETIYTKDGGSITLSYTW